MAIPITPLIDFCNSLICAFCSYKIYQSWQRDRGNTLLRYFSHAYFVLVFSYLFFSLPRLMVPDSSGYIAVGFVLAQACLYLAVAFFAQVTTFFIDVRWVKRVFLVILAVSLVAIVLNVVYVGRPQYDTTTGITNWDVHPVVGVASAIIFSVVLVPSVILFFRQGVKSRDRTVRTRSLLIAGGLLLLVITAYTYYTATTPLASLVSDLFSFLSFLVIFLGVIYRRSTALTTQNR